MKFKNNRNRGFTLIELLITVSIIGILASVVFVALNPLELFAGSRNAQRWTKISQLLTGIHLYIIKNDGQVPNQNDWQEGVTYILGTDTTGCNIGCTSTSTVNTCLDLSDLIQDKHLQGIPKDPQDGTDGNTRFYVFRESGTIITAGVCNPELNEEIKLTR